MRLVKSWTAFPLGLFLALLGSHGAISQASLGLLSHAAQLSTMGLSETDSDEREGAALGRRNASILVDRIKQRTTDELGCAGLSSLESALIRVTRSVRAPARGSLAHSRGFYRGYLAEISESIRDVRRGCDASIFSSGSEIGSLYAGAACSAGGILLELEWAPIYSGWSGGSTWVQLSCRIAIEETLQNCRTLDPNLYNLILALQNVCSD